MNILTTRILLSLIMLSIVSVTHSLESLTDNEMDLITAGSAAASRSDLVGFEFNRGLSRGRHIEGVGSMDFSPTNIGQYTKSSLTLNDNAQNNLSALVNINAVNSPVQILLNLNININSKVDTVNQSNFALPPLVR